ncbi:MAG TPA: sugar phosphate isomerase/epimerase [Bacillales bacterium]|nr:sugar phosphate isomerase/epimerase [Bacillales bacterium]
MGKIGLQLFSVWPAAEKDFLGTVKKTADIGYESIQFAGFFGTPAKDVKRLLDAEGVEPAGAHEPIERFQGDSLNDTFAYHETIGNRLLICPALPDEMRTNADAYKRTAETLNKIGERCREAGFVFGYHNHDFEFAELMGTTGFDLLYEETDPALVKMELDCFWASYAGRDPLELLDQYGDRCVSLHIKDIKTVDGRHVSTEVGNGELDIASLVREGKKHGVDWFTVEQEEFDNDPFDSLAVSAKQLKAIVEETD